MNARPGRRAGSKRTGAITDPRRELTSTSSNSSKACRSPSSTEMSNVSQRRSGEE